MRPTFWPAFITSVLPLSAGCQLVMEPLPDPVDDEQVTRESGGAGPTGAGGASASGGTDPGSSGGRDGACPTPCDCDADGAQAEGCGGPDCDDGAGEVHDGQTRFFDAPSARVGFDYDCSETLDRDPALDRRVDCGIFTIATCNTSLQGYTGVVPECGQSGSWGTCRRGAIACEPDSRGTQLMRCR